MVVIISKPGQYMELKDGDFFPGVSKYIEDRWAIAKNIITLDPESNLVTESIMRSSFLTYLALLYWTPQLSWIYLDAFVSIILSPYIITLVLQESMWLERVNSIIHPFFTGPE